MVNARLIWLEDGVRVPKMGELSVVADGLNVEELADAVPVPLALLADTVHV